MSCETCGRPINDGKFCSVDCAKQARDEAFIHGQKLRLRHASLRKEIATYPADQGRAVLADVIRNMDPELRGIRLRHLLTAPKWQGKKRAEEILTRIGFASKHCLKDLTGREREVLAAAVEQNVFVDEHGFARAAA